MKMAKNTAKYCFGAFKILQASKKIIYIKGFNGLKELFSGEQYENNIPDFAKEVILMFLELSQFCAL